MKTMVEIEREVDTAGVRVSATLDFTARGSEMVDQRLA